MMAVMRYPESHKKAVRERIVGAAARELRAHGLDGVSIPALMKQVGLTHGGFYAHFDDRDELVAEAVRAAAQSTADSVFADDLEQAQAFGRYLSGNHRDHPELGCVVAALGTEGARKDGPVRDAFADVALGLLRLTERKLHPDQPARQLSDRTLQQTSTLVGALVLSRLVKDPKLSDRILAAAKSALA
jgi:TetR/AcrR family transcriptional repressor of nem operon